MKIIITIVLLLSRGVMAQNCLSVDYSVKGDSISFIFKNNTTDTLYLFSSYFEKDFINEKNKENYYSVDYLSKVYSVNYLSAKYLHQIDKSNRDYIISFIPLNHFLCVDSSDGRTLLGQNRIIVPCQIFYKFIPLSPENQFKLSFAIDDIFLNAKDKDNVTKIYTKKDMFKEEKFKTLSYNYLLNPKKYNLVFKFAYYNEVKILTYKELYRSTPNAGYEAFLIGNDYRTVIVRIHSR